MPKILIPPSPGCITPCLEMHHWLHRAFEKRQISDYEFMSGISENEVINLQAKTEEFIKRVE
jgi:uncharacterized protein (UPF0332 family)